MRDKLQATREGRITIAVVNKGIEYCVVAQLGQLGHGLHDETIHKKFDPLRS